jgi:hypothetical protein
MTCCRNFKTVVGLVAHRLAQIRPEHLVLLWHKIVPHLCEYLVFKPT